MNISRKTIFGWLSVIVILCALGYLYIIIPDIQLLDTGGTGKAVEISGVKVTGWEKGKKAWEITAASADANRAQDLVHINDVADGRVYKDGRLVVKSLKAKEVILTSYRDLIEAFGSGDASPLTARIEMSRLSKGAKDKKESGFTFIKAPHLTYNSGTKKSEADDAVIMNKKYSGKAGHMSVDHNSNLAVMTIRPVFKAGGHVISAMTIESYYADDAAKALGRVLLKLNNRDKGPATVAGDMLDFSVSDYSAEITGNVKFSQKGKVSFSKFLAYDDKQRTVLLTGSVKTLISSGEAVLRSATVSRLRGEETRKRLKEGTLMNSDRLDVSMKDGNARAEGHVEVKQKTGSAKADTAVYDDNNETITMTGNVYLRKGDEWIKTDRIIVDVANERFEAKGRVESVFRLKK